MFLLFFFHIPTLRASFFSDYVRISLTYPFAFSPYSALPEGQPRRVWCRPIRSRWEGSLRVSRHNEHQYIF